MDQYQFELWHLIIIIPVWLLGMWFTNYIRKKKYKGF